MHPNKKATIIGFDAEDGEEIIKKHQLFAC
jgi:hypothetical protein